METYTDERILAQPIGYWASMAGRAAVTLIRSRLAEHDLTQPQWWIINYLADRPDGETAERVVQYHLGFVDTDDELRPAVDALLAGGLISADGDRLTLAAAGERRRAETWPTIKNALAHLRDGITDEEFITTIRSLQRFADNAGASAWHA